jgi:DNA mismatch repair protein MutL|tara:strand:- start:859 stop:2721 length:1863 start_codon:yes stop_codon:yes gene_type:complete
MMRKVNRIKLLSEQVANQIAAGEVVERPASVVKELVENALDAGAKKITIEVKAGGRSLIRVTDDGHGMSRDDALMSLERHATSKITRAEDLASINTMGFRGEAVPSIASVSRFTLTTREADSETATQIIINGGKMISVKEAGAAVGTEVEVRTLFFNLPARRKFLRTEETERSHVQHTLTLMALGHPEVAFIFRHNDREIWRLPTETNTGSVAVERRLRALWGEGMRLIEIDCDGELDRRPIDEEDTPAKACRISGFIGAPGVSRSNRGNQHVFVNCRPVDNVGLGMALREGYHTALMKGKYPVCCLFLEIDPAEVDANIHPAKREVKFHREREVRRFVAEAVREGLADFHSQKTEVVMQGLESVALGDFGLEATDVSTEPESEQKALGMGFSELPSPTPREAAAPLIPQPTTINHQPIAAIAQPLLVVPLRILGVAGKLYVVLESDRGMVLMDQHAAHERVLYEQLLEQMERKETASQRLLLPETVELPPKDAQFVAEQVETLSQLGVGLSVFGEQTFLLDALPPFIKVKDAKGFVLSLIDELKASGQGVNSMRLGEDMVIKTVCRHAIKANDLLVGPELEKLLEDLRQCTMPYTCPHGRPTLIEMSYGELEKKFGRTV